MLALGLILILLAALVVLTVLFGANTAPITFDLTFFDVETSAVVVFLLGAATLLVLVTGLGLVTRGTRREMQHRRDRKELARLHAREGRSRDEHRPDRAPDRARDRNLDRNRDPESERSPGRTSAPGQHAAHPDDRPPV